jgi:hypothetical protein
MLLHQLSRGRNFRISDQSQANLVGLAQSLPAESNPFIKTVFKINHRVVPILGLDMAEGLAEPQNQDVLRYLGDTEYTHNLISTYRVLDTSWVTMRSSLSFDYDSQPFFEDVRQSYLDKDGKPKIFTAELTKTQALFDCVMKIKYYLNFLGCLKYVARTEQNEEFDRTINKEMGNVAGFLKLMLSEFPLDSETLPGIKPEPKEPRRIRGTEKKTLKTVKDFMGKTIEQLEENNNTAADSTLRGLAEHIYLQLQQLKKKDRVEESEAERANLNDLFDENLLDLLKGALNVKVSAGGKIIITQSHYVVEDGVLVQRRIPHEYDDEESAVRAQGHIIENICISIKKNTGYQNIFTEIADALKRGEVDYGRTLMLLRKSYNAYERGQHGQKTDVKYRVQWVNEMLRLVSACKTEEAKGHLLDYARGFMRLAARQLYALNSVLSRQISWIGRREKLLSALAEQHILRDEAIRSFSKALQAGMTRVEYMRSIKEVSQLIKRVEEMRGSIEIDEQTERGVMNCEQALTNIIESLKDVRGLLFKKRRLDDQLKKLKAGPREDLLNEAPDVFLMIRSVNEEIIGVMREIMRDALLMNYYLENKDQFKDIKKENKYLQQYEKALKKVERLNSGYSTVYSGEDKIGEAQLFEINKLGFSFKPVSL